MKIDEIINELENKNFNVDIRTFLLNIHSTNLMNNYYLREILSKQIELLELQKGKKDKELDVAVESELQHLHKLFSDWQTEDLIDAVNDSSL